MIMSGGIEEKSTRNRVKVYVLDDLGQWDDKGTGHVELLFLKKRQNVCLVVRSEDGLSDILEVAIISQDIYQRQQDTLIVWVEPETGNNLALSFQEADGCSDIWEELLSVQNNINILDLDVKETSDRPSFENLPAPTMATLQEVDHLFTTFSKYASGREQLIHAVSNNSYEYILKVADLLDVVEDMESFEDLYLLSNIVKSMFFLNDSTILEHLVDDKVFLSIMGILEYDRSFCNKKPNFRHHLKENVKFKQVVPIENPEIVIKIQRVYRFQFLRDVVLARLLEDSTFGLLQSLISFYQAEIVSYIQGDAEFLKNLFVILTDPNFDNEKSKNGVLFLNELVSLSKSLPNTGRFSLYKSFGQNGIFSMFTQTLNHPDPKIKLASTSILANVVDNDPLLVKSFCLAQKRQKQSPNLCTFLISRFLEEENGGLKIQLAEIIRVLLETGRPSDTKMSSSQDSDTDDFLNMFYEDEMDNLMQPLLKLDSHKFYNKDILHFSADETAIYFHLCDLLCFSVTNHSYRSKYYILGNKVSVKVGLLLKSKDTYVRLTALRFFRACIGMKDEFYNRHLIKHEVFESLLLAFKETNGLNNCLNSAFLEFFEFIKQGETIKSLCHHIVDKYRKLIEDVDYVDIFKSMILHYDQAQEALDHTRDSESATTVSKVSKDGYSKIDQDEDDYFNDDEDEEHGPQPLSNIPTINANPDKSINPKSSIFDRKVAFAPSTKKKGLVDYPDDDEEDEMGLKLRKKTTSSLPPSKKKVNLPINIGKSLIIGKITGAASASVTPIVATGSKRNSVDSKREADDGENSEEKEDIGINNGQRSKRFKFS